MRWAWISVMLPPLMWARSERRFKPSERNLDAISESVLDGSRWRREWQGGDCIRDAA